MFYLSSNNITVQPCYLDSILPYSPRPIVKILDNHNTAPPDDGGLNSGRDDVTRDTRTG